MENIKYLIPAKKQYKAQLHVHTNVSDGGWSPEELKKCYMEKGYSIVAYTEHGLITKHPELDDENFLAITSYEFDTYEGGVPKLYDRMYHVNFIAPHRDDLWQAYKPQWFFPNCRPLVDTVTFGDRERKYELEEVNNIIADSNERGFLAIYNHPTSSYHSYPDYIGLEGLWGMEVFNYDAYVLCGGEELNDHIYQDFLRKGMDVMPVCGDDGHTKVRMDGGWMMVLADKLEYDEVFAALKNRECYASCGPEIYSLTLEDNRVKLTCSEAVRIGMRTNCRAGSGKYMKADGIKLTEAVFDLTKWLEATSEDRKEEAFIRFVVEDAAGHKAWTRAYWMKELF